MELLELQKIDMEIVEYQKELEKLPKEIDFMKKDVASLEAILEKEETQLNEVKQWKKDTEEMLMEEEERIKSRLSFLDGVQSGKEYLLLQKELDTLKKRIKDHEAEVLKLMDTIEERSSIVNDRKQQVENLWKAVLKKEEESKQRVAEIKEKIEELKSRKEEVSASVDKTLLRKYNFLSKRRFPAIVKAENERCTGCNMNIPPQLFNSIYSYKKLTQCPYCTRILYIDEE